MKILKKTPAAGLIREFDDNYYDKIRVYKTPEVTDVPSACGFALRIRRVPGLRIESLLFEDLQLRDEEHALPIEEPGDIPDRLLLSYIRASGIDLIRFTGEYREKRAEVGISMNEWEVWLRIWHLTNEELKTLETGLSLTGG